MRAALILGLAITCLAMLAAAFGWDSVRTLEAAYDRAIESIRIHYIRVHDPLRTLP